MSSVKRGSDPRDLLEKGDVEGISSDIIVKGTKSSPERLQTVPEKRPNQLLPNPEPPDKFHKLTHSIILFYTLPVSPMAKEREKTQSESE